MSGNPYQSPRANLSDSTDKVTSPTRISSQSTFFYKRIFPILWFGFLALFSCMFVGIGILEQKAFVEFVPFTVAPIVMAAIGYFAMRSLVFDLVDEVWDAGNELIVKNAGNEERIALKNVINVNYSGLMNPQRVTLFVRESTTFGTNISFAVPTRLIPMSTPATIRKLIERIDASRNMI